MDVKSPPLHNNNTLKGEEECECCSLLNVATQSAEIVVFFTAESWCCGPTAARPGGTVTSYTVVAHLCGIHVYCTEHSHPFQIEI